MQFHRPIFSVIIPAYNSGHYLRLSVESALCQTFANLEVIVVDDGSQPSLSHGLIEISDSRLRVLRQENAGAAAATNYGIAVSSGEFLAFLDHDDLWSPGKLEHHLDIFRKRAEVDLTFCWSRWIDENGNPVGISTCHWHGPVSFDQLLVDNVIGDTSSVVIRRDAIEKVGGFDSSFRMIYDLDLYLRIARLGPGNIEAIPAELSFYRRHRRQMSKNWRRFASEWDRLMEKVASYAPREYETAYLLAYSNMNRFISFLAYESCDYKEALHYLTEGFRTTGLRFFFDPRNWKLTGACISAQFLPPLVLRWLEGLGGIHRSQ